MTPYLHSPLTWLTILLIAPLFWFLALMLLLFVARQYKAWFTWYKGLPIVQYPAMWFVAIGAKFLNTKHCKWQRYNGRIWFSPMVRGFDLRLAEEDTE